MKKLALAVCTLLVFLFSVHGQAVAKKGNPGIANIKSNIAIKQSYADLGAQWWQWALQAPATDTPLFDDGTNCRVGQEGPVWFLAGTLGFGDINTVAERSCDVPVGKAIFFPVINAAYLGFIDDPEEERTAEFVRSESNFCDSNTIQNLSVTVDGVPVKKPTKYYTSSDQSPIFQIQLPTDNLLGAVATPEEAPEHCLDPETADEFCPTIIPLLMLSPNAHQGFYIYVKPLDVGEHTIEWTASWDCGEIDESGEPVLNSENMKYDLTVLPGVTGEVQQ